ncbi:unnamed protein product [Spirodela intermedia]|uniref:RRM domain-containing protein n=1 Tax=Spirodela intermedia TaxID=51605 RepID=A0A7I8LDD8_SPIIN|nr:unnamed protein product [Spirodela intermedia]
MAHRHGVPVSTPGSGSSSGSSQPFPNSPFGDTAHTKLFVGGLAWETRSEALRRYFERFGEILEAVVITHKNTGKSKGYGFVTFRDPESAVKACADPNPIIDGRRANCNLASLGRLQTSPSYARLRVAAPHFGLPSPPGAYVGNPGYPQPVPYGFQPGFPYQMYGYPTYGPEHMFPQNLYNPFVGQQYFQIHGVPGVVNPTFYPLEQLVPGGGDYPVIPGYGVPTHHSLQFRTPNINSSAPTIPTIQPPYPTGVAPVPQAQFMVTPHPLQFPQGGGSDQTTG